MKRVLMTVTIVSWFAVTARAAMSQMVKIQTVLAGREPTTDWVLVLLLILAILVTVGLVNMDD